MKKVNVVMITMMMNQSGDKCRGVCRLAVLNVSGDEKDETAKQ